LRRASRKVRKRKQESQEPPPTEEKERPNTDEENELINNQPFDRLTLEELPLLLKSFLHHHLIHCFQIKKKLYLKDWSYFHEKQKESRDVKTGKALQNVQTE
jgi:hypothetical protein